MARNARHWEDADTPAPPREEFEPRTELGRRLWELRKRIVSSGEPLLDWDDLEREVAERRGGAGELDR
jgi:hypothetical protein